MSAIIEQVLQLSREEKLELLHALEADLQNDDETLEEDDLSKEQWGEIFMREKMLESGEMKGIDTEEFDDFLNNRRNAVQGNKG